ncbi:MAG: hypothetical protein ACSLFJ_05130 [Immundisolibacter sp.]|uniref:hypothetical protein n=1 Tax=Immundisolibacter sp. TaxID=1934948 RepID=UPI003EE12408
MHRQCAGERGFDEARPVPAEAACPEFVYWRGIDVCVGVRPDTAPRRADIRIETTQRAAFQDRPADQPEDQRKAAITTMNTTPSNHSFAALAALASLAFGSPAVLAQPTATKPAQQCMSDPTTFDSRLELPPYRFAGDSRIVVGTDAAA